MFFKKKVGKGVRGEGKNLQSIFIILFFFSLLLRDSPERRVPWIFGAAGPGCLGLCALALLEARGAVHLLVLPPVLLPLRASCSQNTVATRCSHRQLCPRGGTETLGHLGPARAMLRSTSWGCLVSPAVVMPWGCDTWRCHLGAGGATPEPSSCPPWTRSWFVQHEDAQGGVCISQPASAASGLLALHPRVPLQALFCQCQSRRGSERRGRAQPQGW